MAAVMNPTALTLTSVIVQMPTPSTTTTTEAWTSLLYVLPFIRASNTHTVGMMLSLAI